MILRVKNVRLSYKEMEPLIKYYARIYQNIIDYEDIVQQMWLYWMEGELDVPYPKMIHQAIRWKILKYIRIMKGQKNTFKNRAFHISLEALFEYNKEREIAPQSGDFEAIDILDIYTTELKRLNIRNRDVFIDTLKGHNKSEIAKTHNVTHQRIQQIIASIRGDIRKMLVG